MEEILTFEIDNEVYGVDVFKVSEILRADYHITPMPKSSKKFLGVFQPRDKVLNAIDLKYCLFEKQTSLDGDLHNKNYIMCDDQAWFVDSVRDIIKITEENIIPASTVTKDSSSYILGIYKNNEDLIQIIDLDLIL